MSSLTNAHKEAQKLFVPKTSTVKRAHTSRALELPVESLQHLDEKHTQERVGSSMEVPLESTDTITCLSRSLSLYALSLSHTGMI